MGGTPVIDAKIAIPAPYRYAVDRSAARAMLDRGARVGLTVISVGPGYLERQLVESWARQDIDRRVAWLMLDEDDAPDRLLEHLYAAVRVADPEFAPDVEVAALAGGDEGHQRAMDGFMAALDRLGAPISLVLDGVHRLVDPASKRAIATLVRYRPGPARLVVLTRDAGALDFAGFGLSGSVDIGESLLRLDVEQTYRALAAAGLDVSMEDAAVLQTATGGWPAGVFHAARDAAGGTPRFAADAEPVLPYLRSRLTDSLPPDLLRFFLRVGPLGDVNAELCGWITERSDAGRLLDRLGELHLVSGAEPGLRPGWRRVPPHLAAFARHELRAADESEAAELCRTAARWCWERELLEESMQIASTGGDRALMAEILLEHHHAWSAGGEAGSVRRWCGVLLQLDPGSVEVQLAGAWASLFLGDDEAAGSTAALLSTLDVGGARGTFVAAELSMLAAYLARRRGELVRSLEAVDAGASAARSLPDDFETDYRGALPGALSLHVGVASVWANDLPRAISALDDARAESGWSPHALPAIHGHLAVAHWLRDEDAASAHTDVALTHVRHDLLGPADFVALCMGCILGTPDAVDLLPLALAVASEIDEPVAHVLAAAADVYSSVDRDRSRALRQLRGAREVVAGCPEPGALVDVLARAARRVGTDRDDPVLGDPLTAGEERVLRMLGGSLTEREIAAELHLSHNTVRTYRRRLYRKLGVTSRADAARVAKDRSPA